MANSQNERFTNSNNRNQASRGRSNPIRNTYSNIHQEIRFENHLYLQVTLTIHVH